jgi:hypothetical protein
VTRSPKILIPVVAGIAAIAAFYFLALAPKRDEAAALETQISAKQSEVEASKTLLAGYEKAKANYDVNYSTMTRLGKAVPADDDVRSLLYQISHAAKQSKVDFHAINIGSGAGSATPGDGGSTAPGAVTVGSAGFSAMPFSFGFEGNFFRLSDFFDRLEGFVTVNNKNIGVTGRLLLLGSISVTPGDGGLKTLKAQIGATSYLVPPAHGLDGAPVPQAGAAAGAQGAAPPADAGTDASTPTTSATITGVR